MKEFLDRYAELGEEFNPKIVSAKQALRVNTLKITEKELIARLNARLEKIPFLSHGYYFSSQFAVGAMPEHFFGFYYVQEAASQVPATILDPEENDVVLDMAASPGGKTTQMAAMMKNKGTIIALDSNNSRLPAIKNNLERMGVKNCIVYKKDAVHAEDLKTEFDKILLDAPCSGNFAADEDWFKKRKVSDFHESAKLQRKILETALIILKKNGVLVYSTCSLEPEENEENIDWLLEKYPGKIKLESVDIDAGDPGLTSVFGKKLNPEVAKCRRFWPHKHGTQGFFVAKIVKIKD